MNVLNKLFTLRGFLVIVITTLVVIIIKLFLIKYGFDISDFINNFYTCYIFLFLLNLIRFVIRIMMENFTTPILFLCNNVNAVGGGEVVMIYQGGGIILIRILIRIRILHKM